MKVKLFDSAIVSNPQEAVDFIGKILESATEYSIIGKDLDGKILLWNGGACHLYAYKLKDLSGQVRGIFASARDITEQVRLQTQLAKQQTYNRSLIEASTTRTPLWISESDQ